ncbi:MAG: hypothetical protein EXR77_03440 [Myxococcales bacterium]|nr:hypothetical protein [Myxococcales bacterium]
MNCVAKSAIVQNQPLDATHPSTVSADRCPPAVVTTEPSAQRDVQAAVRSASLFVRGDLLQGELRRLDRLHRCARIRPQTYADAIDGHRAALALWLYGIAVGVAAQGLPEAALALLDVLPSVPAGGHGRRELLRDLIDHQAAGDLFLAA